MGIVTSAQVLSLEQAEEMCADRFNLETFNANKDAQGNIPTSFLKKQAMRLNEEEVCNIFNRYCPQGTMNVVLWVKFCKDSNMFSKKKKFLLPDAHVIFQKAFSTTRVEPATPAVQARRTSILAAITKGSKKDGCDLQRTVHYTSFRFVMLLAVAVHKKTDIDVLLNSIVLSHTAKKIQSRGNVLSRQDSGSQAKKNNRYELNFDHQRAQYLRQAKRILKMLEPIPKAKALTQKERQALYTRVGSVSSEDKLRAIFLSYTCLNKKGSKLMGMGEFLQLCQGCELIQRDFQFRDAKLVFKNALLLAASPAAGKALNEAVINNEHMMYNVFRSFAIPHIAEKKKKNCSDVIELFI